MLRFRAGPGRRQPGHNSTEGTATDRGPLQGRADRDRPRRAPAAGSDDPVRAARELGGAEPVRRLVEPRRRGAHGRPGHGRRTAPQWRPRRGARRVSSHARVGRRLHRGRPQRVPGEQPQRPPLTGRSSRCGVRPPRRRSCTPHSSRTRRGATSASRGSSARSRPATCCSPASWSGGSTAKTSEPTTGLGPQIQHWPIFLTVDMGVRMLPWTLGRGRHRPPGRERPDRPGGRRRGLVALGTRSRRDAPAGQEGRRVHPGSRAPSSRSSRRIASRWTTSSTPASWCWAERPRSRSSSSATSAPTPDPARLPRTPQALRGSRSYTWRVACCVCERESPSPTRR